MATEELYTFSKDLEEAIRIIVKNVENTLLGKVRFIEYITLPDYGQRVILRFDMIDEHETFSLEKADEVESHIRRLVGNDYWANLIGSVFHHRFGFEASQLSRHLKMIDQKLPAQVIRFHPTVHSEMIRQDSVIIRRALQLAPEYLIWEIEVPAMDDLKIPEIRIVNTARNSEGTSLHRNRVEVKFGNKMCRIVYLKNSESFWGLIKAYCVAEKNHLALASFIMHFRGLTEMLEVNHDE